MAGSKKDAPKKGKKTASPRKGKSTDTKDLGLDQLSGVSGGVARKVIKATECSTGLLSTCKVPETSIETWCPCE